MKWGKRKGSVTPSSDFVEVKSLRKKKLDEMSNDELKKLTARMDLEQKYKKLNPNKMSKGKAALASVLGTAGMAISIYKVATHPATKAGANFLKNATYKYNAAAGITKAISS